MNTAAICPTLPVMHPNPGVLRTHQQIVDPEVLADLRRGMSALIFLPDIDTRERDLQVADRVIRALFPVGYQSIMEDRHIGLNVLFGHTLVNPQCEREPTLIALWLPPGHTWTVRELGRIGKWVWKACLRVYFLPSGPPMTAARQILLIQENWDAGRNPLRILDPIPYHWKQDSNYVFMAQGENDANHV